MIGISAKVFTAKFTLPEWGIEKGKTYIQTPCRDGFSLVEVIHTKTERGNDGTSKVTFQSVAGWKQEISFVTKESE